MISSIRPSGSSGFMAGSAAVGFPGTLRVNHRLATAASRSARLRIAATQESPHSSYPIHTPPTPSPHHDLQIYVWGEMGGSLPTGTILKSVLCLYFDSSLYSWVFTSPTKTNNAPLIQDESVCYIMNNLLGTNMYRI